MKELLTKSLNKKVGIIGVPYLFGKDNNLLSEAPDVIRKSGLYRAFDIANLSYEDKGNISISKSLSSIKTDLKYFNEVLNITKQLAEKVSETILKNEIPILLGGDHSITIGALLGVASAVDDVSLVYFDAHGDFHTSQTTLSGRLHGMVLPISMGLDKSFYKYFGLRQKYFVKNKAVLFGGQKFDPGEEESIVKNMSLIDMHYIIHYGIGKAVDRLISQIKTKKIYISLDLDVINKDFAPGTDMSIDGALSYREIIYAFERLAENHDVIGMDVVEFVPKRDIDGKTASIAIETITTALGKRIGTYELYMDDLCSR
jgi:arginase